MTCDELAFLLQRHRFNFQNELDLQDGIEKVLTEQRIEYEREFIFKAGAGRIDFLVEDHIGLEVKVGSSLASVTRQLHRYAMVEQIHSLVLVSSRTFHRNLPAELNGKPLRCVGMIASAL
jgi:hypothetical protein